MTKFIPIIAIIFALATPAYADHTTGTPDKIQAGSINPSGELLDIEAKGLVCDFCARALEKVFMKRAEVAGIDVDLNQSRILISLKDGQTMDDATVQKLVTDAGYNIGAVVHKPAKGH